jgi:hypothetical protein
MRTILSLLSATAAAASLAVAFPAGAVPGTNPGAGDGSETYGQWRSMAGGLSARRVEVVLPAPRLERASVSPSMSLGAAAAAPSARVAATAATPSADAVWLKTGSPGLYAVTLDEVTMLPRFDRRRIPAARLNRVAITNRGVPTARHYDSASAAFYFVATEHDSIYSDTNVYNMSLTKRDALPMKVAAGSGPTPVSPSGVFRDHARFEEEPNYTYATWALNEDQVDDDYWFWDRLVPPYVSSLTKTFALPGAAATGTAQIAIELQGASNVAAGDDHKISATLNGVPIGAQLEWDGFGPATLVASFDQSLLVEGDNSLTLASAVKSTGSSLVTVQYLNAFEIAYDRVLAAENNQLHLHDITPGVHAVSGFTTPVIKVVELSGDTAVWHDDITVTGGGGDYTVTFFTKASADPVDVLLVGADATGRAVVEPDEPSSLAKRSNRADYLVIAPKALWQTGEALVDYRKGQFRRPMLVALEDVYDEFGFGLSEPQAIADFLATVHADWRQVPRDVVFLGLANFDYKDRLNFSAATPSLFPAMMTATPWGPVASDNRFADVDGDGLADFNVGRLPLYDDDEGLAYVDKLKRVESRAYVPTNLVQLVADKYDDAGDFWANQDYMASKLQGLGFSVSELYHDRDAVPDTLHLSSTWEADALIYDGHGSRSSLGKSVALLTIDHAKALDNQALPVLVAMTCGAGDDSVPGARSLGSELVVNRLGGVSSAIVPTGLSLDEDAQILVDAFTDALLGDERLPIGAAFRESQLVTNGVLRPFMGQMYHVLGEPVVSVADSKVPRRRR